MRYQPRAFEEANFQILRRKSRGEGVIFLGAFNALRDTLHMDYSFGKTLSSPFVEVVSRVKEACKAQGFGTLTEIDVQATLHEKLSRDIPHYTILGICKPDLAFQAIEAEPNIGVMLPCAALVRQEGDKVRVEIQDPRLLQTVTGRDDLKPIAEEAAARLRAAVDSLTD